jgi:hypothetical protein
VREAPAVSTPNGRLLVVVATWLPDLTGAQELLPGSLQKGAPWAASPRVPLVPLQVASVPLSPWAAGSASQFPCLVKCLLAKIPGKEWLSITTWPNSAGCLVSCLPLNSGRHWLDSYPGTTRTQGVPEHTSETEGLRPNTFSIPRLQRGRPGPT